MCVGQPSRHGGVQYEVWSLSCSSRLSWRMARSISVSVRTTMPSAAAVSQAVTGSALPSSSTTHSRQAEMGSRLSW